MRHICREKGKLTSWRDSTSLFKQAAESDADDSMFTIDEDFISSCKLKDEFSVPKLFETECV